MKFVAALVSLTIGVCGTRASAQDANANTPAMSSESQDDAGTALEAALRGGDGPARLWWIGWTAAYGLLAAGQGIFALAIQDGGLRADAAVGAAKSAVGFVATLVAPHTATRAAAEVGRMDASTPLARARRERVVQELLESSAAEERFWRSWLSHMGAGLINLSGGLVLWLSYGRFVPGLLSFASGMAVAELQIFTHPRTATRALGESAWIAPASGAAPFASWSVAVVPGGFSLTSSF